MIDRERVTKGLNFLAEHLRYNAEEHDIRYQKHYLELVGIVDDAMELLKEQEAVRPQLSMSGLWYECPICHRHLTKNSDNYCARCGRAVKWDELA